MKLFIIFLFTCSSIFAGAFDFNTISSNFKQIITNEENSKITYEGTFYATTQKKALWIYKKPIEKKIYFNQNRVIIIEQELEQAIITNLQNVPNLTELLKSSTKVDENHYETSYEDTIYKIYTKQNVIDKIAYSDKIGNSVEIILSEQILNAVLDDELFRATIPLDFDVVTQ